MLLLSNLLEGPTFEMCTPPEGSWPAPRWSASADGVLSLRAFDQFVVKLHSRCNLACDYCYVYELQDTGWRRQPRTMPAAVRSRLAARIAEHVRRHRLRRVRVILHGGEPLLAGAGVIADFAGALRRAVGAAGAELDLTLQSNGLLLDDTVLELLRWHRIRVGVSLDGDERAHDRHRRRRGRGQAQRVGSHREVLAALERLSDPRYRHLFEGLLCTVDPANDPVRTFEALAAHRPPAIDFLLPHGTWDHPAPGAGSGGTVYGAWLATVFDRWWDLGRPVRVRLFEAAVARCGAASGGHGLWCSEALGGLPAAAVVVEPEGTLSWTDSLKAVADGMAGAGAGVSVFSHSFDAVLALPQAPVHGPGSLCGTCRACPLVGVCGGGTRAHRYRSGSGFANPTVYCADLALLIGRVRARLDEEVLHS